MAEREVTRISQAEGNVVQPNAYDGTSERSAEGYLESAEKSRNARPLADPNAEFIPPDC